MTDAAVDKSSRREATIEIRLGKLQQLFNSLDPSPFHGRDLDQDAEEYIIGWAEENRAAPSNPAGYSLAAGTARQRRSACYRG